MYRRAKEWAYRLLRRSEHILKTDMIYLAKGGFWMTIDSIASSTAVFLLAVAFANLLPKETYGTYKYILSMIGIFSIANLGGINLTVTQAVARGREGVLMPALWTCMRWGTLGSLASIIAAAYYYTHANNVLAGSFLLSALFIPVFETLNLYNSYLQGKKLFQMSAVIGAVNQVLATIAMTAALLFTTRLFAVMAVYFISWTILRATAFKIVVTKFPPNTTPDTHTIPYGKHNTFINAITTAIGSMDSTMLFHYIGASQLAAYSFAMAPIAQVASVLAKLPTLAMPKFAERPIKEIDRMLFKRTAALFVAGLGISLVYIIVAPYIFRIFFPKYMEAVFFSQIFSLTMAIRLPQSIVGAAISSKMTMIPKKMLYLWNIPGALTTGSIFLLIPFFGIIGALAAKFLSLISISVISWIIWLKIRKMEETH
jgi:O-antigen/teichoic acid export membrane protein